MVDPDILVGERHDSRRPHPAYWLVAIPGLLIVGWLVSLWPFAIHDHIDLLDDPAVGNTADRACATLSTALSATEGLSRPERITAGNAAIEELVNAMNALGHCVLAGDEPSAAWIADWRRLQEARSDVAVALPAAPQTQLVMPLTPDGYPITRRMIHASGPSCETAITLAAAP
ncbi:hypothetical protein [Pengzhenrongella phosphoraccumulans]|uniref:hypothetical protein n=1 Tax=Pengzhenrongella phosphoraccumulans TaxID=3114394 RepID=UPI00388D32DA